MTVKLLSENFADFGWRSRAELRGACTDFDIDLNDLWASPRYLAC